MIKAYLDSYSKIIIKVSKNYYEGRINSLFMEIDNDLHKLNNLKMIKKADGYVEYMVDIDIPIELGKEYYLITEYGFRFILEYRYITKDEKFKKETYTNEHLGYKYKKSCTTFSLWAPISNEVVLVIDDKDYYKMEKINNVFFYSVKGDLDGCTYYYLVKNNGKMVKVMDPYTISYNYEKKESVVIDLAKLKKKVGLSFDKQSKVIYEANVRDFSSSRNDKYNGKFLGVVNEESLDYLDNLGIEYLQLMPINYFNGDIYGNKSFYNWGYNPFLFGTPHPNYVYELNNPYAIVDECKEMINKIHRRGVKVTVDVVFNHLENREDNVLNMIVPYYYYLMREDKLSNGSYCGVDLDSKAPMMNRLIKDMCKLWVDLYNVDGFRFDLLGILDFKTINEVYEELKLIKEDILIYGEGWNMPSLMEEKEKAIMTNAGKMKNIAFFNDYYRESLKYDYLGETIVNGDYICNDKHYFDFNQSINYLECHDNYTYYDLQKYVELRDESLAIRRQLFKNLVILISNGYAFLHSGQEFFRTKKGSENSYCKPDDINTFDWNRMYKFNKEVNLVEKMIKLREKHNLFSIKYSYSNDKDVITLRGEDIRIVLNMSNKIIKLEENEVILTTNKKQLEKYDLVIYRN